MNILMSVKRGTFFIALVISLVLTACQIDSKENGAPLFELLSPEKTNVSFANNLDFTQRFNIYRYRNYYDGGGVALGDINNDGFIDIYFTSNRQSNRLYLNKGNMKFEDITQKAGVSGSHGWTTGVSMADVNGDGLLDIYVCNSGILKGDNRQNELFINNGDSTFSEKAEEFGLADTALSIHASFFDYDRDGDLDMYLVNNSVRMIGSFNQTQNTRTRRDDSGGDKLYRNDGNNFIDVSAEAGIYGSDIGFGLGVSVADLNRDGWQDMYISNDFFERDYLYINNKDGTFKEVLEDQINSISAAAMGADVADLNNDGLPEIFVTDMLPEQESRLKKLTTFDSWERYQKYIKDGYYHQFTRNTLQLNNGNKGFSEVGRFAGVEATDWSWGANIADFNLDGRRDIFVANGMYRDITNLDYLKYASRRDVMRQIITDSTVDFMRLIDNIPSTPISNYAFQNMGGMKFENRASEWGLDAPVFSNGSAYGDLDNDGDLELVINNLNSPAAIYRNNAADREIGHWLTVKLEGKQANSDAIGAQLTAWINGTQMYAEQMPVRGFQSTVDQRIHLGLGDSEIIDSLIVRWPNGNRSTFTDIATNQILTIKQSKSQSVAQREEGPNEEINPVLVDITKQVGINWKHKENDFNDFNRDPLLFHMRSSEGPALCVADANSDGFDDFYVGGAKGQAGSLFIQQQDGTFIQKENPFLEDRGSEDISCTWFDANGDKKLDLYVGSGSNEFSPGNSALADRLYLNEGNLSFNKFDLGIAEWRYKTAGSVSANDFDKDGDTDLFLGVRLHPFGIGIPTDGYLLENDGKGNFKDVTKSRAPNLKGIGMITDSAWGDIDNDGDADLLVTGEWMATKVLINEQGNLTLQKDVLPVGWWKSIFLDDLDGDGDLDFIAGNLGQNTRFNASKEFPLEIFINDFDENGKIEQIIATYKNKQLYPLALRHNLIDQLPYLKNKYPDYKSFADQTMSDIFDNEKLQQSQHIEIKELSSVVGWNDGKGAFRVDTLPLRAQLSPIYGIASAEIIGNGKKEILMGGNLNEVKPEAGRYDATSGMLLRMNSGDSITDLSGPFKVKINGQLRHLKTLNSPRYGKIVLAAMNNGALVLYKIGKKVK